MRSPTWMLLMAALLVLPACVPTSRYDAAVNDAQGAHADAARRAADEAALHAEVDRLNTALRSAEALAAQRDKTLSAALAGAQGNAHDLQGKLDGATAENDQLRKELARLGKNADSLLAEKGMLASALEGAKARLEELRKAQAAADARAALFKQLALKFQKMIDAGELKVALRNGRMVIQMSNDVLFDSGQTDIKPSGKAALTQVGDVLRTIQNRSFQVAGDTDNVPIQTALFPSNWELSTRRAVEVVHFLMTRGIRPEVLSAAGYGEFDPVASNDSAQGRKRNRRIEIVLQPNIDELVAVPEAK
jgi:chemotaxis protein MotB